MYDSVRWFALNQLHFLSPNISPSYTACLLCWELTVWLQITQVLLSGNFKASNLGALNFWKHELRLNNIKNSTFN